MFKHSPLEEFYDSSKKKICLLDDNFLGFHGWKAILQELIDTGKPFNFKQGLDERLLTDEKCEMLFSAKYDNDYTFAFDNVEDYALIESKIKLIRKYNKNKRVCFYVLVGFRSTDAEDIANAFKRIELLMKYGMTPYIMRYQSATSAPWKTSKYSHLYETLAAWCNQPHLFRKMTLREFAEATQERTKTQGYTCVRMQAINDFEKAYPEIAKKYFDLKIRE